jgi:hypothetical protein
MSQTSQQREPATGAFDCFPAAGAPPELDLGVGQRLPGKESTQKLNDTACEGQLHRHAN